MHQVVVVKTIGLQHHRFIAVVETTVAQVQKIRYCGENLFFCRFKMFIVIFGKPLSAVSKVLLNHYTGGKFSLKNKNTFNYIKHI